MRDRVLASVLSATILLLTLFFIVSFIADRNNNSEADGTSRQLIVDNLRPMNVVVLGDSLTDASSTGGQGSANWTAIAGQNVYRGGGVKTRFSYIGGPNSGYFTHGPRGPSFIEKASRDVPADTDLIIFFGGNQDQGMAGIGDRAADAWATALKSAPAADVLVVGAVTVEEPATDSLLAVNAALSAEAARFGHRFVDPLAENWFTTSGSASQDGVTVWPTNLGHAEIAERLTPPIIAAVQ